MSIVNLAFRPKSYFGPTSLEDYLERSIHGAERRRIVARYIEQGRLDELPPVRGGVRYRIVDEYEGETLTGTTERESPQPLTLGELLAFFMGAWDLFEACTMNFDEDLDGALGFFSGSSAFYPEFAAALDTYVPQRNRQAFVNGEPA